MPGCVGEGYRPYFENYTVDASILDSRLRSWITKISGERLRVLSAIIGSATFRVVVS